MVETSLDIDMDKIYRACQLGNVDHLIEIIEGINAPCQSEPHNFNIKTTDYSIQSILSTPDSQGILPLHWAALNGRWMVAKYLLDQGVAVDALSGEQSAPALHWAVCKGHISVAALLLRYGANWKLKDLQGYNAMHVAAQNGHEMMILFLKAQGADIDTTDGAGRSPLLWAAYRGHAVAVETLIKHGAQVDLCDDSGRTPLHWAVIKGHSAISAKLLKAGAALDIRDVEGKMPGDWARVKEVKWFERLNQITVEYRRSQVKPRTKVLEAVGTVIIPCLLTPSLMIPFIICNTLWFAAASATFSAFILYNISAQVCIPPGISIAATPFLSYFNYSTLFIIEAIFILYILPNQIYTRPVVSLLCLLFSISATVSLFRLKVSNSGKLTLPRNEEEIKKIVSELGHDDKLDKRNFCTTCSIRKPLRSKHCKTCDRCVSRFDHHCPWINNCVGFHNHRTFMFYLYTSIGFSITFLSLTWSYLNTFSSSSASSSVFNAGKSAPGIVWIFCFAAFMSFWVLLLTAFQTYQIIRNMTTNEFSNSSRLEYFYPQLSAEDVPFEQLDGSEKSSRFVNVFSRGIFLNWIDFWSHPMERKHNLNNLFQLDEEYLKSFTKNREEGTKNSSESKRRRSSSASSIPIVKAIFTNIAKKTDKCGKSCCSKRERENLNQITLKPNSSESPLLEGVNMV